MPAQDRIGPDRHGAEESARSLSNGPRFLCGIRMVCGGRMERGGALLLTRGRWDCRISRKSGRAGTGLPGSFTGDRLTACRQPCNRCGIRGGVALTFGSGRPVRGFPKALGHDDFGRKVRKTSPPIHGAVPPLAGRLAEFALFGNLVDNCLPSRGYDHYPLSMTAPVGNELDLRAEFEIKVFATARTEGSAYRFRRELGAMTADVREKQ